MTPEFLVPRRPAAKKVETLASPILQLKVRLLDISPMIWRRVLVPASYTLRELHGVIQVAMGWESLHLYYFHIRAVQYGSFDLCVQSPDVALAGFRFRKGARFTCAYDMGDFWRHEIRIEDGLEPSAGQVLSGLHRRRPWLPARGLRRPGGLRGAPTGGGRL